MGWGRKMQAGPGDSQPKGREEQLRVPWSEVEGSRSTSEEVRDRLKLTPHTLTLEVPLVE